MTKLREDKYYKAVQIKREQLTKNFLTGLIDLATFLREIGLVSLKAERKAGKVVLDIDCDRGDQVQPDNPDEELVRDDSDNDSLR